MANGNRNSAWAGPVSKTANSLRLQSSGQKSIWIRMIEDAASIACNPVSLIEILPRPFAFHRAALAFGFEDARFDAGGTGSFSAAEFLMLVLARVPGTLGTLV